MIVSDLFKKSNKLFAEKNYLEGLTTNKEISFEVQKT